MLRFVIVIFIFFSSFFLTNPARSSCAPTSKSCDFYHCLEDRHQYGKRGYPLSIGYRYCSRFDKFKERFTSNGQIWIKNVMQCLMNIIKDTPIELSRRQFKKMAMAHPPQPLGGVYLSLVQ